MPNYTEEPGLYDDIARYEQRATKSCMKEEADKQIIGCRFDIHDGGRPVRKAQLSPAHHRSTNGVCTYRLKPEFVVTPSWDGIPAGLYFSRASMVAPAVPPTSPLLTPAESPISPAAWQQGTWIPLSPPLAPLCADGDIGIGYTRPKHRS